MTVICPCGEAVPKRGGGTCYEEQFCSTYCREYNHQGLKKVKGLKGSKHHRNHIAYPVIKIQCIGCGADTEMKIGRRSKGRTQLWCSNSCMKKVRTTPIRRSHLIFTMLCAFKHRRRFDIYDGWMDSKEVYRVMSNFGNRGGKNIWTTVLRNWAAKGFLTKRQSANSKRWEYRMSDLAFNSHLGRMFYESTGNGWDSEE